ncbi:MAG: SCO family protein [Gemmatimonadales bacterium]|nr:SCO family protein [Gemmatimonadales bacterium]MDZ4389502.1 SCO family protein [Gemmatimonadales bacterium]
MRVPFLPLVLVLLGGCSTSPERPLSPNGFLGRDLDQPLPKPALPFVDSRGGRYDLVDATDGKVTLLFFGYTNCPDICPVHLANIAAVLKRMPDAIQREVRVVFITADPARDTLARLGPWVRGFHRDFVGLTGEQWAIDSAQRLLGLVPAVLDTVSRGREDYLVGHAGQVIAFTRDGMARVQYPFGTRQRDWAEDLPRLIAWPEAP